MEETVEARLIAVIGAGAMGSGIAQVAATSGFRVNLSDVSAAVLEKALVSIQKSLARLVKAGTLTQMQAAGARGLAEAHGSRFSPPRLLLERVEKGHLGRKTGKGFYDHG